MCSLCTLLTFKFCLRASLEVKLYQTKGSPWCMDSIHSKQRLVPLTYNCYSECLNSALTKCSLYVLFDILCKELKVKLN